MIKLPDFSNPFDYENGFYLSCDAFRIRKFIAHYEAYKHILDVPGDIVECGVFKGASFHRFALFRKLFESEKKRRLIGFDSFGKFPPTSFAEDQEPLQKFIDSAGDESISVEQMEIVLKNSNCFYDVELVKGNICQTILTYLNSNPNLSISLLNLDTDVYEPAVTVLENLWSRISPGGLLLLDDYGVFPGETKAVDEFFNGKGVHIEKFSFCDTPCFIVKN